MGVSVMGDVNISFIECDENALAVVDEHRCFNISKCITVDSNKFSNISSRHNGINSIKIDTGVCFPTIVESVL
jgi:hypothetical protein